MDYLKIASKVGDDRLKSRVGRALYRVERALFRAGRSLYRVGWALYRVGRALFRVGSTTSDHRWLFLGEIHP